jgi:hypothetical protein
MRRIANDKAHPHHSFAQAVLSSGVRDADGRYALLFRNEPWANGAVWSLNVSPALPGSTTGATVNWSPKLRDSLYKNNPHGELDGEYLDSLEGYVTANLDFDRGHFRYAQTPLTFDTRSKAPAQHKALQVYEFARSQSRDVHALGKLMFANSVPHRFSFLAPWLDIMGTETNWLPGGKWRPDSDASMNLRRTMSGPKPYLLLQNTDFEKFTPQHVQKYFEKALFYGVFPSFFSPDAATNPYWQNPLWYNRDRSLFKKYMPIIKPVAEAGWQPVTLAVSDNSNLWIERFGQPEQSLYLTLHNSTTTVQSGSITLHSTLKAPISIVDLVSGQKLKSTGQSIKVSLQPEQTMAIRLNSFA